MQSINREILNPVFFLSFMGTAFLLPISTFIFRGQNPVFLLLLLSTLAYLIGVFGVTMLGNIPLNNQLDQFDIVNSTSQKINEMRSIFENRWNFFNNIRTVFSVIAIVLIICACVWNKLE